MNTLLEKIQHRFKSANIVEQIIYINVLFFFITFLFKAFASLMLWNEGLLNNWFALPAEFGRFINIPWSLITYGFLHGGFLHILFNSILLFYFGNLFLDFFSKKQFLNYYFLGIMAGGIVFMLSYNYFPALKNDRSYLIGASAGIMAIVIGIATKIPNYAMHFRFIGAIKLWYIAVGFVLLDVIQIPIDQNTGGHLAHLGGALIGFLLTNQFQSNKKSSSPFSNVFKSKKQKPLKTVYKKTKPVTSSQNDPSQQRRIDEILDKISKSGYETLSKEEKDFLFSVRKK